MYGIDDRLRSTLNAKHSAVNAKAVACSCAPFLIGVVIVIAGTFFICFDDTIFCFCICQIINFCNSFRYDTFSCSLALRYNNDAWLLLYLV